MLVFGQIGTKAAIASVLLVGTVYIVPPASAHYGCSELFAWAKQEIQTQGNKSAKLSCQQERAGIRACAQGKLAPLGIGITYKSGYWRAYKK